MADELEDNFILDDSVSIAESDGVSLDGDPGAALTGIASGDEQGLSDAEIANERQQNQLTAEQSRENKKRKRKEKEKAKKQKRAALAAEFAEGVGSVATRPPDMQADYLTSKQRATFSKLSSIELEEFRLREASLVDTTSFDQPRKEETLDAFVRRYAPRSVKALTDASSPINNQPGQPAVIVLTGNAQRAADLAKSLRRLNPSPETDQAKDGSSSSSKPPAKRQKMQGGASASTRRAQDASVEAREPTPFTVAKLFARHFKLKEHQAWLKEHVCPLASGTPQRVHSLVGSGALCLDSLEVIVIDQTWVDAKQRTVLDTPETRDELVKLLASEEVLAALRRSKQPVKVALF